MPRVCTEVKGVEGYVIEQVVRDKYEQLTRSLIRRNVTITAMESCTGGQVSSLITDTEGASAIFKQGFVTYCNEAKVRAGVCKQIIDKNGVYSSQTAAAMANACRRACGADIGLGVTGTFGNADPDNSDSVPGEVYFAIANAVRAECFHCLVPVQPSRLLYKLYMADVIADRLEMWLTKPMR